MYLEYINAFLRAYTSQDRGHYRGLQCRAVAVTACFQLGDHFGYRRWPPAHESRSVSSCRWLKKIEGGLFDITEWVCITKSLLQCRDAAEMFLLFFFENID